MVTALSRVGGFAVVFMICSDCVDRETGREREGAGSHSGIFGTSGAALGPP